MVPDSPMPFAPSGLRSVDVSTGTAANGGRSAALGIAYVARLDVSGFPESS